MKYLVVSDNHGNRQVLEELVARYKGKVDLMIHCGDSELDPEDSLWQDMYVVTGNCDYDPRFKLNVIIKNELDTIYVTHGHRSNVRMGLQSLFYEGKEAGANILLYGHTHILHAEELEHTLIVNPGSICQPRGPVRTKTYAIIESTDEKYLVTYFDDKHEEVKEFHREFPR